VRGGTLNKRLQIDSRVENQDEVGEPIVTWTPFATVWAAIEPQRGREFTTEQQPHAQGDVRIRIRYLQGVEERMRASYGSTVYDIQAVLDLKESHEEMHLICIKGMSDG